MFRGNFKRKVGSSFCSHMISVCVCFCVCICLIFRFAYLPYHCLSVERRLSKLSLIEKIFNDSIPIYQEALIKAGYNQKLTYQKHDQEKDNWQQRKRQIFWFNPQYCIHITTKVRKFLLSLIDKLQLPTQYKISNKRTQQKYIMPVNNYW